MGWPAGSKEEQEYKGSVKFKTAQDQQLLMTTPTRVESDIPDISFRTEH